jgi:hypothetical protein
MAEVFSKEQLDEILDEIAKYEVELVEDPTQPQYGFSYIQKSVAQCRSYLNRVQYYLQKVKKRERDLRIEVKQAELNLDLKMQEMLADNEIVRQQPSEGIKKAVAASMLKEEAESILKLKVELLDIQETGKIIKLKYDDLQKTNGDIRLQRQLVKDDKAAYLGGEDGYSPGGSDEKGRLNHGMAPAVTRNKIDPKEILDPDKRPDDLPEPLSGSHAEAIADFFNREGSKSPKNEPENTSESTDGISYEDLLK